MTSYIMIPGQELDAYVHQVSGRAHMLSLNKTTLCKSIASREWNFYLNLPSPLRPFTPELKGLLYVLLEKGADNSHRFKTSGLWIPPPLLSNQQSTVKDDRTLDGARDHAVHKQTMFKGLDRMQYDETNGFTRHPWTIDKDQEALTEAVGKNPWSIRQHRREINRTLKGDTLRKEVDLQMLWEATSSDEATKEVFLSAFENVQHSGNFMKGYLLLDDVTSGYEFPCVVDLKIGTQMGRRGCSKEKKDKHENLVKMSSTGSIGIRLAGMQVYQVTTGQFLCRDKYYGRGLSSDGFREAIKQFLHNGQRLVAEVVPDIISRLMELRNCVSQQETFRFYASSVLISYDGAVDQHTSGNVCDESVKVGVHMIDFAHSTFRGFLDDKIVYDGPDNDCLVALDNLISLLRELIASKS